MKNFIGTGSNRSIKRVDVHKEMVGNLPARYFLFSRHSARIESYVRGGRDAQRLMVNQVKCSEMLLKKAEEKVPLSVELIEDVHRFLMDGVTAAEMGERDADGLTSVLLNVSLAELKVVIDEVVIYSTGRFLPEAVYLHAGIIDIYPFAAGNEMVGRNILNYYLLLNGQEPLIIFTENREDYFKALADYCNSGDLASMNKFFEDRMITSNELLS